MRRPRLRAWSRRLVAENSLSPRNLVLPLFVHDLADRAEIPGMPGTFRLPVDMACEAAAEAWHLGIPAVMLFPATPPERRTPGGDEALDPDNLICRATRQIRSRVPDIGVICDVALDPYTDHGHDGLVCDGQVANDATVRVLARQACVQAAAGCSAIAPSDMMDGRIGEIRKALDAGGFQDVLLFSYAAKYASAFYGPFRDAVGSPAQELDKSGYQMDPANSDEALAEVALDLAEGADAIIVKPGLPCLDICRRVGDSFAVPLLAYQVSGEYAMIRSAAACGYLPGTRVIMETLMAFRRAGCDAIISYFALEAARELSGK